MVKARVWWCISVCADLKPGRTEDQLGFAAVSDMLCAR